MSGSPHTKPLFSLPARLCYTFAAFWLWMWAFQTLAQAVVYLATDGTSWDVDLAKLSLGWRLAMALFGNCSSDFTRPCVLAIVFFLLMGKWPRYATGMLLITAAMASSACVIHFAWMLDLIRGDADSTWWFTLGLYQWCAEMIQTICSGLVPLMLLALAEELDRQAISREANRVVRRAEDASLATERRARRHRDLIAIASGGGLRPWMAVPRVLTVALLAGAVTLTMRGFYPVPQEYELPAPLLSSQLTRPPAVHPHVRIWLSAARVDTPGTNPLFVTADATAETILRGIQTLKARRPLTTRIELDVGEQVRHQQIVDVLNALLKAGFRDVVFVDERS